MDANGQSWEEKLPSMRKEGFIDLARHIIYNLGIGRIVMSASKPALPLYASMDNVPRIDIVLSGRKHIQYPSNGQVIDDYLLPGDMIYSPPLTSKIPIWDNLHEMSGLVFTGNLLRMTYINLKVPTNQYSIAASNFYHTSNPPGNTCKQLLQLLTYEMSHNSSQELIRSIMKTLLLKVLEELENDASEITRGKSGQTWQRLHAYVMMNFQYPITREEAAWDLHLNPSYISQLFHDNAHMTFGEFLREVRLDFAKQLLGKTDKPIKEITSLCGYQSSTFLISAFRKQFGITPGKYRISVQRKQEPEK